MQQTLQPEQVRDQRERIPDQRVPEQAPRLLMERLGTLKRRPGVTEPPTSRALCMHCAEPPRLPCAAPGCR